VTHRRGLRPKCVAEKMRLEKIFVQARSSLRAFGTPSSAPCSPYASSAVRASLRSKTARDVAEAAARAPCEARAAKRSRRCTRRGRVRLVKDAAWS